MMEESMAAISVHRGQHTSKPITSATLEEGDNSEEHVLQLDYSEPTDVLSAIHVEDGLVQDGVLERLDHSQPDISLTSMLTQAPPLLLPIDAPILPTPQTRKRGKERCRQEPTRQSARIASKPKTNLTMEEQATALLIKRSGVLFSGNTPNHVVQDEFMGQFTEPLKNTAMGGFKELFGIPDEANGADSLAPLAIEGTA
jgi:hypothetical protein